MRPAYQCSNADEAKSKPEEWKLDIETDGYRLPTEAEWEFACKYSPKNGNETKFVDTAWSGEKTKGKMLRGNLEQMESNQIKPNCLGVYLMRGNALELVSDWFGNYEEKFVTNPVRQLESSAQARHVARGGHLGSSNIEVTPTYRQRIHPEIEKPQNLGIRLVIPLHYENILNEG